MTTHHKLLETAATHLAHSGSEGGLTLDFDLSFLGQMVAFTLLVLILKPLLFDPMMKLFEERERRTEGAKLLAKKTDERAADLLRRYEAELERVRRSAAEEREQMRSEGQKVEAKVLEEARLETARVVEQGRAQIAQEAQKIRVELAAQTKTLAHQVASSVLGREVG